MVYVITIQEACVAWVLCFGRGRSCWQSGQYLGSCHRPSLVPVHQRADWQAQSLLPITLHAMHHAEPPFSPHQISQLKAIELRTSCGSVEFGTR